MSNRTEQSQYNIPMFKVNMSKTVKDEVGNVLLSGRISQYNKVDEFETILKDYIGNKHILTTNSGTNALHLAYHLLKDPIKELNFPGLNNDDYVLTTPLTCVATNWPILANNLNIKWVDIDPDTFNINIDDLKKKINHKTKIISIVHWGGTPVNLNKISHVQDYCEEEYGFRPIVIEDAAHSFGAEFENKKLGNHGNIVMYSFQAIKHLTTVDGGLLCLPNEQLYNRAKLTRWFGISRERKNKQTDFRVEDDIEEYGFKFHMNDVNASVGICNFPSAIKNLEKHRSNANFFNENLKDINCVTLLDIDDKINSSYWIYTIKINNRDNFISYMSSKDICTSQIHGRNDIHSCVKCFQEELPILDTYDKQLVCLPVGWWLEQKDIIYIVDCIKEWDKLEQEKKYSIIELSEPYINEYKDLFGRKYDIGNNEVKKDNRFIYIITKNNELIGCATLFILVKLQNKPVGLIEDVMIKENKRKKGYGNIIVNHLKQKAIEMNCYKIILDCKEFNTNFYTKCDYSVDGVSMRYNL